MNALNLSLLVKRKNHIKNDRRNVVTVFSGLSTDNTPAGFSECSEVGKIVAERGFDMVCAGASIGCQKNLITEALDHGGKVIAVTVPKFAKELLPALQGNAIISNSPILSERKNIMKNLSTFGYIILPGGPGTFDELWEVIAEKTEGLGDGSSKNIVVINTEGFFNPVREQLRIMADTFKWDAYTKQVIFIDDIKDLNKLFDEYLGVTEGGRRRHKSHHTRYIKHKSRRTYKLKK